MKQLISVPVGSEPKIRTYPYNGSEYIDYGYAQEQLYPTSSLKSLIEDLNQLLIQYRDRYQDMRFEEKNECGCYHQCSCRPSYVLYGKRYETDLEYNFRLKKEAEAKAAKEARERAEYEKLKAKFEGSE